MSRNFDPLYNLADALSEDIVAAPAQTADTAHRSDDGRDDAMAFDRIATRATAQARRRRIAERMRTWLAAAVPAVSWKPAMVAVAGLAVVVVAGDFYIHQRSVELASAPAPAPAPVLVTRDALPKVAPTPPDQRLAYTGERSAGARDAAAVTPAPAPAAAPPVVASAPPPAPAAAAGVVVDEPKRIRTVTMHGEGAAPSRAAAPPTPRAQAADGLQALIDDQPLALAPTDRQKTEPPSAVARVATVLPPAPAPGVQATRAEPASAAPVGPASFIWPLRGRLLAGFGSSVGGLPNNGIDIAVPAGTEIHAAADGVVVYAGDDIKGMGNLLLVRHRDGFITAYANTQKLVVKKGDNVRRGQVIAKSGRSGTVSEPQLHFEIRKGSTAVDPAQFLPPR